jgi:hypothetical protein
MSDRRSAISDSRVRTLAVRRSALVVHWLRLAALLTLALIVPAISRAQDTSNRAGLVIRHGNGHVLTICVRFDEPTISGAELLNRAGVSYLAQSGGMGTAVCKLDGEGCDYPTEDCFCHCKGGDCAYWSYEHLRDGLWNYSQIGAAAYKVQPGAVEGWAWGPGNVQSGAQPPLLSFAQICTEVAAPATVAVAPPPTTAEPPPAPSRAVPTRRPPPTHAAPSPAISATPSISAPPTALPATAVTAATAAPAPTSTPPLPTAAPAATHAPATHAPATISDSAGVVVPTRIPGQPSDRSASATSYLAFGALALLLAGGIVGVLLRRRTRGPR